MSFIFSWFRSKTPSKPHAADVKSPLPVFSKPRRLSNEFDVAQSQFISTLEETKTIEKSHNFSKFKPVFTDCKPDRSKIKKNSIWDLLSDYSVFTDSEEIMESLEKIPVDYSKSQISQTMASSISEKISGNTQLLSAINERIAKQQENIISLYFNHKLIEYKICSLIEFKAEQMNLTRIETIKAELNEFKTRCVKILEDLDEFIKEISTLLTIAVETKEKLNSKQYRAKYSTIGASAVGLAVGVLFPYIAAGGVAISFVSGGVMIRKNRVELLTLAANEKILFGLTNILIEKKDKFEFTIEYLDELMKCLDDICNVDSQIEIEAVNKLKKLVPLNVLSILKMKRKLF